MSKFLGSSKQDYQHEFFTLLICMFPLEVSRYIKENKQFFTNRYIIFNVLQFININKVIYFYNLKLWIQNQKHVILYTVINILLQ